MNKALQIMSWITIALALGFMFTLIYWMVYPYKIAEFTNLPFPILNENKIVRHGERVKYLMKYCKYTNIIPELKKFFYDGVVFEVQNTVGVAVLGCHTTITDVYVSKSIPAGTYSIKTYARYRVNPIRIVEIVNTTEQFTVVE